MESTRIVLDSTLCTKHQAEPGRQESVSMVECIYAHMRRRNNSSTAWNISRENILQNWIPNDLLDQWFFSANTKGWTSNLHWLGWLKRVFEPTTRTKAGSQYRLPVCVCDGHVSY
jgi:hypothetical protein